MKKRLTALHALIIAVLLLSGVLPAGVAPASARSMSDLKLASSPAPDVARVAAALGSSPVMFVENFGQFDAGAHFQVMGGDRTIWLADDAIWVTIY